MITNTPRVQGYTVAQTVRSFRHRAARKRTHARRKAAARAAADDLYLYGGGLTPELAELIERTFRGVHVLAYLKHEEMQRESRTDHYQRAVDAARTAQDETMEQDESDSES